MTTYHLIVVTVWIEDAELQRRDMRIALDYPGEWSGMGEQPESVMPCDPPVTVADGRRIPEDVAASIQADANAVVLVCEVENG